MADFTQPHNIPYPVPADYIRDPNDAAKLASDIKAVAVSANDAITAEGARAEEAAVGRAKYRQGNIPGSVDIREHLMGVGVAGQYATLLASTTETQTGLPADLVSNPVAYTVEVQILTTGTILELSTFSVYGVEKYSCSSAPSTGDGWTRWKKGGWAEGEVEDQGGSNASGFKTLPLILTAGRGGGEALAPLSANVEYDVNLAPSIYVSRYRFAIRDGNPRWGSSTAQAIQLANISVGGVAKISSLTTNADGSITFSPWMTGDLGNLKFDYTAPQQPRYIIGGGRVNGVRRTEMPFELWIEVETPVSTPAIGLIGDSNSVAVNATIPVNDSWMAIYCRNNGFFPVLYGHSGDGMSQSGDPNHYKWNRWNHLDKPDMVVHANGANDIPSTEGGITLAEMQERARAEWAVSDAKISKNKHAAVIKSDANNANNTVRVAYNNWLKSLPDPLRDWQDIASPVTTNDTGGLLPQYLSSDNIHMNTAGQTAIATSGLKVMTYEIGGLSKWFKGTYTGSDVYADTAAGLYFVPDATGIANWPTEMSGVGGFLEVKSEAGVVMLTIDGYGVRPYTFRTYRDSVLNGTFHPWERTANLSEVNSAKWFKGLFAGSSVFGATAPGQYYVTEAKAGALTDWPAEMSGVGGFLTVNIQDGRKSLRVEGYGARPYIFTTQTDSVMNNTFHPWARTATQADIDAVSASIEPIGLNNVVLADEFTRRRGGVIGTDGKAVIALRFDDPINGLINSGVAAELSTLGIPASAAHCSGSFTAPDLIALSNLGSWQTVIDWAHHQGMEVHHHGGNHADASGDAALKRETIDSLALLKASLPTLEVNKWMQPGVGGTNYDGFASTDSAELFYSHPAGRMILGSHAVSSGYMAGTFRQLDGKPRNGLGHHTVDTPANLAAAYGYIDEAIETTSGLCLMLHPNNLDREGDYSTSADFIALLQHLATLRDAGQIEILTVSGLLCADTGTDRRAQVIRNGDFADGLTGWLGATGWTATGGVASTSGTTLLNQSHNMDRYGWFRGGTMQLVAEVQAETGADVVLHQSSLNDAAGWTAERTVALPASAEWVTVRLNACVPIGLAKTDYAMTKIGRLSGGTLNVRNVRYQSV